MRQRQEANCLQWDGRRTAPSRAMHPASKGRSSARIDCTRCLPLSRANFHKPDLKLLHEHRHSVSTETATSASARAWKSKASFIEAKKDAAARPHSRERGLRPLCHQDMQRMQHHLSEAAAKPSTKFSAGHPSRRGRTGPKLPGAFASHSVMRELRKCRHITLVTLGRKVSSLSPRAPGPQHSEASAV